MSLPSLSRIPAPPDPILGLAEAFKADTREGKINLSSGVFVDETGKTPVLGTVIEAERRLAAAAGTKLYRPIDGEVAYREHVRALALGVDHEAVTSGRALADARRPAARAACGSPRTCSARPARAQTLWMSEPTWPNHPQLFLAAGFRIRTYPYTDATGRRIDEAAMLEALGSGAPRATSSCSTAPATTPPAWTPRPSCGGRSATWSRSGACCRSSTSPTRASATACVEDAAGLLELVRPGVELIVSTSFSKTFSLYAERVGALLVIARSAADAAAVQSHVKVAIRVNYSNPPAHGADIVRTILADTDLRPRWEMELAAMRDRIKDNRRALVAALEARASPATGAIATQRGMFALLGPHDAPGRAPARRARGLRGGQGPDQRRGLHVGEPGPVRGRAGRGARDLLRGAGAGRPRGTAACRRRRVAAAG